MQHIAIFCVSVRSRFGLERNLDLFYFWFNHTMNTWAEYKNQWNILKWLHPAKQSNIQKIKYNGKYILSSIGAKSFVANFLYKKLH